MTVEILVFLFQTKAGQAPFMQTSAQNRDRLQSMTQDTYAVIIFWIAEDQAFIASVPELLGCMAHGETRTMAIEQIEIAIENWINTAREIGREIPKPTQDWARSDCSSRSVRRYTVGFTDVDALPKPWFGVA